MGYGKNQIEELEKTINNSKCDIVVSGTPIDLNRIIKSNKKILRVKYSVGESTSIELEKTIEKFINKLS
jgi:predicted GTPase